MDSISNNQNCKIKNNKPSKLRTIAGIGAGYMVSKIPVNIAHKLINPKLVMNMESFSNFLTKDEFEKVTDAVEKTIKQAGLDKKGVSILKATSENSNTITEIILKEINNGILKFLPKTAKDSIANMQSTTVEFGQNAFYTFKSKKIIIPKDGLSLAGFHEVGHAMNANLGKLTKGLQSCRQLSMLAIPIMLIALLKNKKEEGEQPKNKLDKATDFIKNNAGKLTFIAWLPTLAEEGLASLKGNNLAKKLLSPDLAKKVAKSNAYGFATYALLSLGASVGIALGVKVKDAIFDSNNKNKNL